MDYAPPRTQVEWTRTPRSGPALNRTPQSHAQQSDSRSCNYAAKNPLKKACSCGIGTKRVIILEDLRGIRSRTTVRIGQRGRLGKWAFGQLRAFMEYRARIAGSPVLLVDPRDTSRRCSSCGHNEKANRRSQAHFRCRGCGFGLDSDLNAAMNIRGRADVIGLPPRGSGVELQLTNSVVGHDIA